MNDEIALLRDASNLMRLNADNHTSAPWTPNTLRAVADVLDDACGRIVADIEGRSSARVILARQIALAYLLTDDDHEGAAA